MWIRLWRAFWSTSFVCVVFSTQLLYSMVCAECCSCSCIYGHSIVLWEWENGANRIKNKWMNKKNLNIFTSFVCECLKNMNEKKNHQQSVFHSSFFSGSSNRITIIRAIERNRERARWTINILLFNANTRNILAGNVQMTILYHLLSIHFHYSDSGFFSKNFVKICIAQHKRMYVIDWVCIFLLLYMSCINKTILGGCCVCLCDCGFL